MRIVGGSLKGRNIKVSGKLDARPTTDMAREALFNILEREVNLVGLEVLDLFAGTGAISFEFISRGASRVTCVDVNQGSRIFINKIIRDWSLENIRFVRQDIFKMARRANQEFDLVFADPPYDHKKFAEIPELIMDSGWLKPNSLFILEHGGRTNLPYDERIFLKKQYGAVHFDFYRMEDSSTDR